MGASIVGRWPGITYEHEQALPGFWNDCGAWADWLVACHGEPEAVATLKAVDCAALLSCTTEGEDEEDIPWVSPQVIVAECKRMIGFIRDKDPRVPPLIELYGRSEYCEDSAEADMIQDLSDVQKIAESAQEHGATSFTLDVNW